MDNWWTDIDDAAIECLRGEGPMAPDELGRRLGISEGGAASLVSALAREGKVRICLVELREKD
jgi:DNA-binding Lrp family transcriptional regulator